MKRHLFVAFVIATLLVVGTLPAQAYFFTGYWYAQFREITYSYHGGQAYWSDVNWTNLPCPAADSANPMNAAISEIAVVTSSNPSWIGLYRLDEKYRTNGGTGTCTHEQHYVYEYSPNGTGSLVARIFPYYSPPSSHTFSVNRLTTGCSGGASYCWHWRIDGDTQNEPSPCCTESLYQSGTKVVAYAECQITDPNGTVACPVSGLQNENTLKYKKAADDIWYPWAGKDSACVDYNNGNARGDWVSDTTIQAGFNTGSSGSSYGQCHGL